MLIDGFTKPSVVVLRVGFSSAIDPAQFERSLEALLGRSPRWKSRVRYRFGIPWTFASGTRPSVGERLEDDSEIAVSALVSRWLREVPSAREGPLFEVRLSRDARFAIVRIHHVLADGTGAVAMLRDFSAIYEGRPPILVRRRSVPSRARRLRAWVRRIDTHARFPADALSCDFVTTGSFSDLAVDWAHQDITESYRALRDSASRRGLTLSEWLIARLFRALEDYDAVPREERGILVARARASRDGRYAVDQVPLTVPAASLRDSPALERLVATRLRSPPVHADVQLALLYAKRLVFPPQRTGHFHAKNVHFTYSDLSHWDLARLGGPGIAGIDVVVSPSHPEHAGMLITRMGDRLKMTLVAHRGVVTLPRLGRALRERIGEDARIPAGC